ncbi:MAG: hypothetical protein KAS01_02200 [Candidatus Pacebacteria bacterium]|nr:hypothetical protein [Candidatus Paceibacterota bacterium]
MSDECEELQKQIIAVLEEDKARKEAKKNEGIEAGKDENGLTMPDICNEIGTQDEENVEHLLGMLEAEGVIKQVSSKTVCKGSDQEVIMFKFALK